MDFQFPATHFLEEKFTSPKNAYHSYQKQIKLKQKKKSFYQLQRLYEDIQRAYEFQGDVDSQKGN